VEVLFSQSRIDISPCNNSVLAITLPTVRSLVICFLPYRQIWPGTIQDQVEIITNLIIFKIQLVQEMHKCTDPIAHRQGPQKVQKPTLVLEIVLFFFNNKW